MRKKTTLTQVHTQNAGNSLSACVYDFSRQSAVLTDIYNAPSDNSFSCCVALDQWCFGVCVVSKKRDLISITPASDLLGLPPHLYMTTRSSLGQLPLTIIFPDVIICIAFCHDIIYSVLPDLHYCG